MTAAEKFVKVPKGVGACCAAQSHRKVHQGLSGGRGTEGNGGKGLYCGCVGRTDKAGSVGLELAGLNIFSGFWGTGHGDSFVVSTCCWVIRAGGQWPGM